MYDHLYIVVGTEFWKFDLENTSEGAWVPLGETVGVEHPCFLAPCGKDQLWLVGYSGVLLQIKLFKDYGNTFLEETGLSFRCVEAPSMEAFCWSRGCEPLVEGKNLNLTFEWSNKALKQGFYRLEGEPKEKCYIPVTFLTGDIHYTRYQSRYLVDHLTRPDTSDSDVGNHRPTIEGLVHSNLQAYANAGRRDRFWDYAPHNGTRYDFKPTQLLKTIIRRLSKAVFEVKEMGINVADLDLRLVLFFNGHLRWTLEELMEHPLFYEKGEKIAYLVQVNDAIVRDKKFPSLGFFDYCKLPPRQNTWHDRVQGIPCFTERFGYKQLTGASMYTTDTDGLIIRDANEHAFLNKQRLKSVAIEREVENNFPTLVTNIYCEYGPLLRSRYLKGLDI